MLALNEISVHFAQRMFQAARDGDAAPLLQAIDAGLPVNMTNDKGSLSPSESIEA